MHFPNPWAIGMECLRTFLETLEAALREQRMQKEAKLQLELARPPVSTSQDTGRRIATRLQHNAAALRPFLQHNEQLTFHSEHPLVHAVQTAEARRFIVGFHLAERALKHEMGHIPLATWQASDSFRDRFSKTLSENDVLYQQIAGFTTSPKLARAEVVQTLARELQIGGQRKPVPQME